MRLIQISSVAVLLAVLGTGQLAVAEEESLGSVLAESKWDRIIGTWIDEATNGNAVTTTYAWKFKGRVLEVTTTTNDLTSVALIGRNASSGEIFHMGADDQGGSSLGKWTFDANESVLELVFTAGDGQQGGLKLQNSFENDDRLKVSIEVDTTIEFTMIRKKELKQ